MILPRKLKSSLSFVLLGLLVYSVGSLAHSDGQKRASACDTELESKISLTTPGSKIHTPESEKTLARIRSTLVKIPTSRRTEELKNLYAQIQPEIDETLAMIEAAKAMDYPQELVARISQRFSLIIEFPAEFVTELADLATGGCSNFCMKFDRNYYNEMRAEFAKGRKTGANDRLLQAFTDQFRNSLPKMKLLLDDPFHFTVLRGTKIEEFEQTHFFQYKYIYETGESAMIDFVKVRETGQAIIGIKLGINGNHDGQHSTASGFERHDYQHAKSQKVKDQQLFDFFGITEIKNARRLKALNQKEALALVSEWEKLKDVQLKTAVEVLLFALMHEQCVSYPTQVLSDLSNPEDQGFYQRASVNSLQSGRFGLKAQRILGSIEAEQISKAIEWVKSRAKAADLRVTKAYSTQSL